MFGDEARDDYDTMKIAELVRDGTGAILVNEAYIPPALRIDSSPFLMGGVRRLLSLMVTKQRQLAGDRHQRDGSKIEFNAGDVTKFLQLSTINTRDPAPRVRRGERRDQPDAALPGVDPGGGRAGDVLAGRRAMEVPGAVAHRSARHIRGAVRPGHGAAAFGGGGRLPHRPAGDEPVGHVGKLEDERLLTAGFYLLAVRTELPEHQLLQRLPGLCKIASSSQLPQVLRSAATPGVPIQATHRPPPEIPVRAGRDLLLPEPPERLLAQHLAGAEGRRSTCRLPSTPSR